MKAVIAPLLTEKAAANFAVGQYVFSVHKDATKTAISESVKALYGVDVAAVRIVNLPAKKVSFRRKPGSQAARHKAYVQLKAGQKIAAFELPKDSKAEKEAKRAKQPSQKEEK